jgi:YesN/AraC family two-component response regulator
MQRNELRIKKTLYYIETHFREQITIDDIAASAKYIAAALSRDPAYNPDTVRA